MLLDGGEGGEVSKAGGKKLFSHTLEEERGLGELNEFEI